MCFRWDTGSSVFCDDEASILDYKDGKIRTMKGVAETIKYKKSEIRNYHLPFYGIKSDRH